MADSNENAPIEELKICQLKAKGLMEEIDRRSTDPSFFCGKCRAKADLAEHLHNPLAIKKPRSDSFWG